LLVWLLRRRCCGGGRWRCCGSRAAAPNSNVTASGGGKKGFCSSLLLRSPPLLLLRFLSPLVCFVSLLFFFFPFPLNLTVPLPFVSSPVLSFLIRFRPSQFGFTGGSFWFRFSFPLFTSPFLFLFRFVPFSLFLCYFSTSLSPPFSSLACWRCGGVFIGKKERGLFIVVHGEQGSAGLAGQ